MNSQNPFPKRQHDQKWTFYEITTSIMSAEYQYVIENAAKSITNWSCHAPAFLEQFNWSCKRKFSVCLYQTHQTWQLLDQLDWSSKLKTYACLINLISKNRSSNGLAVIPRFCTIPTIFFFNFKFFFGLRWKAKSRNKFISKYISNSKNHLNKKVHRGWIRWIILSGRVRWWVGSDECLCLVQVPKRAERVKKLPSTSPSNRNLYKF